MKTFLTELKAIDPKDGQLKTYAGRNIKALTRGLAQQWCDENEGYLTVVGELVSEIPCKTGTLEADFSKKVDYIDTSLN